MDLKSWCAAERGRAARLAKVLGVDPVMVSQWANGTKPIAWERCTPIETGTGGDVRRWDTRPDDWWQHWPELKGVPGAPPLQLEIEAMRDAA